MDELMVKTQSGKRPEKARCTILRPLPLDPQILPQPTPLTRPLTPSQDLRWHCPAPRRREETSRSAGPPTRKLAVLIMSGRGLKHQVRGQ